MAGYSIFFKESVRKDLSGIASHDLKRIMERISALSENPHPAGSEKLVGQDRYRVRQGSYRIVYSVQDAELTVWVVKVCHRKEVYR